ncbi:MAG: VCBS repeat-containing protein, partial [Planctomycetota bacterium]
VMAGDLNGDGAPDAFIADHISNTVLLGHGNGSFTEQVANPDWYNGYSTEAALGDLDGDGDLDAWVTGYVGSVWLNDGVGNFTTGHVMDPGVPLIHVVLADLDNDGDLDAATAASSSAIVWENQGDGTFEPGSEFSGGTGQCRGIDVGDLDGNGELDIFLACEFGHVVGLADGNGDYNTTTLPFGAKNVALGDLDGDGDLDAFDANLQGPNRVWVNDGLGGFTASSQPHLAARDPAGTWEVDLGDIDRDGDLDAVGTFVWRNDGSGNFSEGELFGFNHGVELEDWDLDGDLDVIVVDYGLGPNFIRNRLKTIEGTSGDDVIEIEFLADHVEVLINGQSDSFGIESYMAVDGLAGNDQIIVRGPSSQNAHASGDADTGSFSVRSDVYQLAGTGFEDVTFDSINTVELYGSSDPGKKDQLRGSFGGTFPATVDETTLHAGYVGTDPNTADYIFRALSANHVESFGRGGSGDYAQLFGSDYDDHFYRFADHELLVAGDSTQRTQGFARVDAFGRHGTDVAYFVDTTGDDHFYTFPEFVVMVLGNDQDRVMAKGFLDVTGVSEKGGADTAHVRNAQTFDTLFASSNVALLLRQEQRESVLGFANLNATALSGETPLQLIDDAAANVSLTGTW